MYNEIIKKDHSQHSKNGKSYPITVKFEDIQLEIHLFDIIWLFMCV